MCNGTRYRAKCIEAQVLSDCQDTQATTWAPFAEGEKPIQQSSLIYRAPRQSTYNRPIDRRTGDGWI